MQAGVGDAIIISAIRQAKDPKFDISTAALVQLKASGVSDTILAAMMSPSEPVASPVAVEKPSAAPPDRPTFSAPSIPTRAPGIYLDAGAGPSALVLLEPAVFSQGKTGGIFTSAMTYGIYKAKWKAVVRSPKANIRTAAERPTFYFYFEQTSSALGAVGGFAGSLSAAASPNEFVLAQMSQKRDSRELVVGEFGVFGSTTGTRSEDTVPLQIERTAPGSYRVVPTEDLGPGEFCFFHAAGANTLGGGATGKLFDFGVDRR